MKKKYKKIRNVYPYILLMQSGTLALNLAEKKEPGLVKETSPPAITEQRNPNTVYLDQVNTLQMVEMMNQEDHLVAPALKATLPQITAAVDEISKRLAGGGGLFYIGTGTSERLGSLDASECPLTFNVDPDMMVGINAGGERAIRYAVEEIEDRAEQGAYDLPAHKLTDKDCVVGLATSGRTPYVIGAIEWASQQGAFTVGISCVPRSQLEAEAQLAIVPIVVPEVLSGSNRLKA